MINEGYKNGITTILTVPDARQLRADLDKRVGNIGISCTNLLPTGEGVVICR